MLIQQYCNSDIKCSGISNFSETDFLYALKYAPVLNGATSNNSVVYFEYD